MAVQQDGKILIGGNFSTYNDTFRNRIARLLVEEPAPKPDLTPIIYTNPTLTYGNTSISVVVKLIEVNGTQSNQTITLLINHDSILSLSLPASATSLAGHSVNNSVWTLSRPTNGHYTLTTNQPVSAGGSLSVGLLGTVNPNATSGTFSLSTTLIMENEQRINNNTDVDKIDYF